MARCLIGCGANAGEPRTQLDRAVELLGSMPGIHLLAVSRTRQTAPVGGPPGQPPFVNGACLVDTDLEPHDLLDVLAAVENTFQRDRAVRWGPRTIDLDLLLYDDCVIDGMSGAAEGGRAALTVPHPRMATRRFVLEPCAEIAPDAVHPLSGCTVRELLDNISGPALHVAVVGVPGSGAREVATAIADATLARPLRQPSPLPAGAFPGPWLEALAGWAEALAVPAAAEPAPPLPVATVADCWLGSLLVAAEGALDAPSFTMFRAAFQRVAGTTAPPRVAILVIAGADTLAERLAYRSRAAAHSDVFGDTAAVCAAADPTGALVDLQGRLAAALARRRADGADPLAYLRPPAVVVVPADDLGQAIDEAVAAVEAVS